MNTLEAFGVEKFLRLLRAEGVHTHGDSIRCCCPVHHGHNPSAFSYHNGIFTCFSDCNRSYSPVQLVMHAKHMTYYEAKDFLEHKLGSPLEEPRETRFDPSIAENLLFLQTMRKKKKHKNPPSAPVPVLEGISYLHPLLRREGFDDNTREAFHLTYAIEGFMKNRTLIPIHNKDGLLMGYAGRLMQSPVPKDAPKYRFTKGLQKSETLYNIHRAKQTQRPYLIVCEGYKSVWRLHQWGLDNACALMGASISDTQKRILLTTNKHLLLCGDNDEAGEALNRDATVKLQHFCHIATFPISRFVSHATDSIAEARREDTIHWLNAYEQRLLGGSP